MQDAPISCPYCNTLIPPSAFPASGRIRCPRCGDSFQVRANCPPAAAGANLLDEEVRRHRTARQAKAARSIKTTLIAGVCLGALGLLVGVGISYFRTEPAGRPPAAAEDARSVPPLEMLALRYLPAGTDSVIALQLRPLLDSRGNGAKGAAEALVGLGIPASVVDAFERAGGIAVDDIDQIVVGLKLSEGVLAQQPVLVVHTRQDFSIDKLAQTENARSERRGERTYHRFPASAKVPFEIHWWAPNERILVAALQPDCLDPIPDGGFANLEPLTPRIKETAASLLTADTACWAILDSDKWDSLGKFVLGLEAKRNDDLEKAANALGLLQTAVLGIRLEGEPILTAWFEFKLETAAADLRARLTERFRDEHGKTIVGGAGNRVMVRTSLLNVRAAIQKAFPDLEKGKR